MPADFGGALVDGFGGRGGTGGNSGRGRESGGEDCEELHGEMIGELGMVMVRRAGGEVRGRELLDGEGSLLIINSPGSLRRA